MTRPKMTSEERESLREALADTGEIRRNQIARHIRLAALAEGMIRRVGKGRYRLAKEQGK